MPPRALTHLPLTARQLLSGETLAGCMHMSSGSGREG